MHCSQPLVAVTLLLVCYSSQASLAHNTCDELFKKANVSAGRTVSLEECRKMQLQENFNRIDTDGNGALTRAEVAAQKTSDPDYKREDIDALNAQIIRIDRNMDGFLQASEYRELMAEGTVYGFPPNFSEITKRGRIDYCELSTSLALHHGRRNFAERDTNNDNVISFNEYVAHADITSAITLKECLEHETNQGSPSACPGN